MSRFIQLHLLTSYPPANLNRDDLGRPKTAVMGGAERLRVSSQSLKRAWRQSDVFEAALGGHIGVRTKALGVRVYDRLTGAGVQEKEARAWARTISGVFGAQKKEWSAADRKKHEAIAEPHKRRDRLNEELEIEQLVHLGPEELAAVDALVEKLVERGSEPQPDELALLREDIRAVDVALFGRMVAASPLYNVEAAAQVAHAISVHPVVIQDDFFTAVDDLNAGNVDRGAGHMGETEFAAGLFYLYLCIDRELLTENLGGDDGLARAGLSALITAACTIAPTGKQNSFASRARASFALCEAGDQQPRSLSVAFLRAVRGSDMLADAVNALTSCRTNMEQVYGACADRHASFNAALGTGSLDEVIGCATT